MRSSRTALVIALTITLISSSAVTGQDAEPEPVPIEVRPPLECSFAGVWQTTYGPMTIAQDGTSVSGTYGTERRVDGEVQGGVVTGSWSAPPSYSADDGLAGDIEFVLSDDCETFSGGFRRGAEGALSGWGGSLVQRGEGNQQRATPGAPTDCTFTGVWDTTYGQMTLEQSGTSVSGTYTKDDGLIDGVALGDVLTARWSEAPSYAEVDEHAGDVEFVLSADCASFTGKWRTWASGGYDEPPAGRGWNGTLAQEPVEPAETVAPSPAAPAATADPPAPAPTTGPVPVEPIRPVDPPDLPDPPGPAPGPPEPAATATPVQPGPLATAAPPTTQPELDTPTPEPGTIAESTATLVAEERIVAPEDEVTVPVRLERADELGSLNVALHYDPSVVQVDAVVAGGLVGDALFAANTREPGVIRFGLAVQAGGGVNGDGVLAEVDFIAVGPAGSSSPLTLDGPFARDVGDVVIDLTLDHGLVHIEARPVGDYDGDGCVTPLDAEAALRMSVRDLAEDLNLDVDGDGRVTAEDARLIMRDALTAECPGDGRASVTEGPAFADPADVTDDDVKMIVSPFDDDLTLYGISFADGTYLSVEGTRGSDGISDRVDRAVLTKGDVVVVYEVDASGLPSRVESFDAATGDLAALDFAFGADELRMRIFDGTAGSSTVEELSVRYDDHPELRPPTPIVSTAVNGPLIASLVPLPGPRASERVFDQQVSTRVLRVRTTVEDPEGLVPSAKLTWSLQPPDLRAPPYYEQAFLRNPKAFIRALRGRSEGSLRQGQMEETVAEPGVYEAEIQLFRLLTDREVAERCNVAAGRFWLLGGIVTFIGLVFAFLGKELAAALATIGQGTAMLSASLVLIDWLSTDCDQVRNYAEDDLLLEWLLVTEIEDSARPFTGSHPKSEDAHPDDGAKAESSFTGVDVVGDLVRQDVRELEVETEIMLGPLFWAGRIRTPSTIIQREPATFKVDAGDGVEPLKYLWTGRGAIDRENFLTEEATFMFGEARRSRVSVRVTDAKGWRINRTAIIDVLPQGTTPEPATETGSPFACPAGFGGYDLRLTDDPSPFQSSFSAACHYSNPAGDSVILTAFWVSPEAPVEDVRKDRACRGFPSEETQIYSRTHAVHVRLYSQKAGSSELTPPEESAQTAARQLRGSVEPLSASCSS